MGNNKDIGKAFREKLKDLDKVPDDKVWNAIRADLQKKKKRRFILPFWFKTTGIFLLSAGLMVMVFPEEWTGVKENLLHFEFRNEEKVTNDRNRNNTNTTNQSVIDTTEEIVEENTNKIKKTTSGEENDSKDFNENNKKDVDKGFHPKIKKIAKTNNRNTKNNGYFDGSDENKIGNHSKRAFSKNKKPAKNSRNNINSHKNKKNNTDDSESIAFKNQDSKENVETMLNKNNDVGSETAETQKPTEELPVNPKKTDSLKTPDKKPKKELPKDSISTKESEIEKIKIFVFGSPTYGKYLSDRSPIDKTLDHNPKNSKISLSYGAYAIYEATPKWSLRFGITIQNLQFETKGANANSLNFTNVDYTNNLSNADVYNQSDNSKTMDILQKISYTEIPLELKYTISGRKLGISTFGGLSYRFLGKNEVTVTAANGAKFDIGETKHLSSNAFSINAGIGLDYKFSEFVRFNLEPVIKFHLFDYKHNQVNPYTIGILAGLQFTLKK